LGVGNSWFDSGRSDHSAETTCHVAHLGDWRVTFKLRQFEDEGLLGGELDSRVKGILVARSTTLSSEILARLALSRQFLLFLVIPYKSDDVFRAKPPEGARRISRMHYLAIS